MDEPTIYEVEKNIIKTADRILKDDSYKDDPLINEFADLSKGYKKLFHQFSRMVKISDRQQQQLLNTKEHILKYNE